MKPALLSFLKVHLEFVWRVFLVGWGFFVWLGFLFLRKIETCKLILNEIYDLMPLRSFRKTDHPVTNTKNHLQRKISIGG